MKLIKNASVLFAMLALLAGCGDSNRSKIVGKWQMEKATMISRRFNKNNADSERPEDSDGGITVTFFRSGSFQTKTNIGAIVGEKQGAWIIKSFDEEKQTVTIDCTINSETTEHQIEIVDEETIRMVPPNMAGTKAKFRFRRAK